MRSGFLKTAFIMILCVFFLSSCGTDVHSDKGNEESGVSSTEESKVYDSFSLAYNSAAELNPFTTDSFLNIALSQLIADPLVFLNAEGECERVLLEDISAENGNTVYKVKIKDNRVFSDGTEVTANDVESSVRAVLSNPQGFYYGLVKNIFSVTAENDTEILFTLTLPDPDFERMLCFPVIKEGSKDENYIGSGIYTFYDNGEAYLKENAYRSGEAVTKLIRLSPTDNALKLHTMLQEGKIDYYYSTDASITAGSFSGAECVTDQTGILLFNSSTGACADRNFRYLLGSITDRERIVSESGLYIEPSSRYSFTEDESITVTVDKYLTELGFNRTDEQGFRYKKSGGKNLYFELSLACVTYGNSEDTAESIVGIFAEYGIRVNVTKFNSLEKLVEATAPVNGDDTGKSFDIAVTELKLTPNNDLSSIFDPIGGYACALSKNDILFQKYILYLQNSISPEEFEKSLNDDFSVMTLYNCKAKMLYNRLFAEGIEISRYTPYYKAYNWYIYE